MEPITEAALAIILSSILSMMAWKLGLLTPSGALSAFAVGTVIGVFGSLSWLLVLLVFTFIGFAATRYGLNKKKEKGLQEGRDGERTHTNVLAVALAPCLVAIVSYALGIQGTTLASIAFIASISVAASDTIASEMGVMYPDVWMITTLEKVPPGTDGGVSVMGTVWAFLGAGVASMVGWIVIFPDNPFSTLMLIPVLAGFFGCVMDSVLGATLETSGYINKYSNNFITMLMGSLAAAAVYLAL